MRIRYNPFLAYLDERIEETLESSLHPVQDVAND